MNILSGYRTYILAAAAAGITFAHVLGYLPEAIYQQALAFLGIGSVVTLRAAVGNK